MLVAETGVDAKGNDSSGIWVVAATLFQAPLAYGLKKGQPAGPRPMMSVVQKATGSRFCLRPCLPPLAQLELKWHVCRQLSSSYKLLKALPFFVIKGFYHATRTTLMHDDLQKVFKPDLYLASCPHRQQTCLCYIWVASLIRTGMCPCRGQAQKATYQKLRRW